MADKPLITIVNKPDSDFKLGYPEMLNLKVGFDLDNHFGKKIEMIMYHDMYEKGSDTIFVYKGEYTVVPVAGHEDIPASTFAFTSRKQFQNFAKMFFEKAVESGLLKKEDYFVVENSAEMEQLKGRVKSMQEEIEHLRFLLGKNNDAVIKSLDKKVK